MNFVSILVVLGLFLYQTKAIELYCNKNAAEDQLTFRFRNVVDGTAQQIEAINIADSETNGCKSSQITEDSVLVNELVIIVDLNTGLQISPTIATSNCFVTSAGDPPVYTVHVVRQQNTEFTLATDILNDGDCDPAAIIPVQDLGSGNTVLNTLTATSVTAVSNTIAAKLVDNTGADLTPPIDIGTPVRLYVSFNPPAALTASEGFKGIQIYNVEVSGYSDFRMTFQLITGNGCINQTSASALSMTEGVKHNGGDSSAAATPPLYVFQSGLFNIPLPDGPAPKTLYLRFSYLEACPEPTQQKCNDQEQYCTDNALTRKRRSATEFDDIVSVVNYDFSRMKRSAPETGNNGTMRFAIPLNVYSSGNKAGQGGKDDGTSSKVCEAPNMYWIMAVVLGVLLLATMVLCVFLVLRLRKEQKQNEKIVEKTVEKPGHRNPAYY